MMKKITLLFLLLAAAGSVFAQEEKPSIVVMDFYYKDISAKDMSTSAASVTEALENTEMFDVINVEDRNTILRIRKFVVETCLDPDCQAKAARALGVDLYLSGDIGRLANKYIFHMSISDALTGETVYEGDKLFEDFSEMVDNLKVMTYEICGVDPATMPQDDVIIIEKEVFVNKLSPKDILSIAFFGVGGAALITGTVLLVDANSFYKQVYRPAYDTYYSLPGSATMEEWTDAFNEAEEGRQTFVGKLVPGIIVAGSGLIVTAVGLVIALLPDPDDKKNDDIDLGIAPAPTGFGLSIKY